MRRRASHHITSLAGGGRGTARGGAHGTVQDTPASAGGRFDFDPHGLPWRLTELDLSFEFFEIRAVFVVEGEG